MTDTTNVASHEFRFPTAIGPCVLRWSERGISAVSLLAPADPDDPHASRAEAPLHVRRAAGAIAALMDGERTDLRFIPLDMDGFEPFRRAVYEAAREIPAGATLSYGDLAAAAGHPGAAREVGAALARNPFLVIVPCHRVLAADGALTGFSAPGGVATKRRMLEIERAPGFEQQPLFA